MFNNDPALRSAGQKVKMTPVQVDQFVRASEDLLYFAENFFEIVTIDEGKQKIVLHEYQKRVLKAFVGGDEDKRKHNILLSSRQIGKTTLAGIYILWYALFQETKEIAILANREKTAMGILRRIKDAYHELPLFLQQGIVDWSKTTVTFENGSRIICGSTSSSSFRGESIALLYLDEFAFVPSHVGESFIRSVFPTISSGQTSKIIISSTPNGMGPFYHLYREAVKNENNFRPIKVNWWEVPGRDEEWKEAMIRDIGAISFNQEYGAVFLGSSNTLIDGNLLERLGTYTKEPLQLMYGHLMKVYEPPEPDGFYILGVDSAKGTGNDYSVIQILKIVDQYEIYQVAVYRNNVISAHEFAQTVIGISELYNNAYVMLENNDVGGEVAQAMFWEYEFENILNCDKDGIGIRSTKKSKLAGNILLKRYVESSWLHIYDKRTHFELSVYEETAQNIFKAGGNEHDDCVLSMMWGLYFLATEFFDGKDMSKKTIEEKFRLKERVEEEEPVIITDTSPIADADGFDWSNATPDEDTDKNHFS
jgi:hypothetical protein